jgi:ribosomal protein S26
MRCEKCGRDVFKFVVCNYCGRKIGQECIKSSKRKSKVVKLVICKDCWSILPRRKAYKNAEPSVPVVQPQAQPQR